MRRSLQAFSKINISHLSFILFKSDIEAVKEIFSVSFAEWFGVGEASTISVSIRMILHSLHNIPESVFFELLFCEDGMHVITLFSNIT